MELLPELLPATVFFFLFRHVFLFFLFFFLFYFLHFRLYACTILHHLSNNNLQNSAWKQEWGHLFKLSARCSKPFEVHRATGATLVG